MSDKTEHTASPVCIALVGLGGHGGTLQRASVGAGNLDVVAVYDPDKAEAEAAALRFGCVNAPSYEALLQRDDLDAISLCTPNHLHPQQVGDAVAVGLDVFVEKPIANTVAEGKAMIAAAEAAGRILMVGHNMRYAPVSRTVKALLAEGRIGEVVNIEIHFSSDTGMRLQADSWRLRPDQCPLLPMMQLGIHAVDLVHYFLGRVETVTAEARSVVTPAPVIDSVASLFRIADGPAGTLVSNYCSSVQFSYQITGTEGTLMGTPHTLELRPRTGGEPMQWDTSSHDIASYANQMRAFGEAVQRQEQPETDGWVGLQALAVIEAMMAGITRHETVAIPDVRLHSLQTGSV